MNFNKGDLVKITKIYSEDLITTSLKNKYLPLADKIGLISEYLNGEAYPCIVFIKNTFYFFKKSELLKL